VAAEIKILEPTQNLLKMNIKELFSNKPVDLLNIYVTAGYPQLDSLKEIIPALSATKVDIIEVGIPYSDPLSDGPTIQKSNMKALDNGITLELIFEQLAGIDIEVPLVLMGYFNSIMQFGIESFAKNCERVGVSGLIIPDLPIEIYLRDYKEIFDRHMLSNIFLVTPNTTEDRLQMIDKHSSSFIYAVSSSSTTGNNKEVNSAETYLRKLNSKRLKTPFLVGFNIRNRENFEFVNQYASGGIIGSAFINYISQNNNLSEDCISFVKSIK